MTLHKLVLSVWTAYLSLIGCFMLAEYHLLKAQPISNSPLKTKATSPSLTASPSTKKNILDYTTLQQENARLQEKNKLLTLAYTTSADNQKAEVANTTKASPVQKQGVPARHRRRRRGFAQQRKVKRTPVQARRTKRRRGVRGYKASAQQSSAPSMRGKSSPLRRKPLKNVSIKVTHIKPATAHASWKKLHREALFAWPVAPENFWVSSLFGPRKLGGRYGFHAGVDMAAPRGTPVHAAGAGIIVEACYSAGYGNYILIAHNRKFKTRYAHLDKILVRVGQNVCSGDCIGRVGATGFVRKSRRGGSASHLHFEVYMKGKPVNPFFFLA